MATMRTLAEPPEDPTKIEVALMCKPNPECPTEWSIAVKALIDAYDGRYDREANWSLKPHQLIEFDDLMSTTCFVDVTRETVKGFECCFFFNEEYDTPYGYDDGRFFTEDKSSKTFLIPLELGFEDNRVFETDADTLTPDLATCRMTVEDVRRCIDQICGKHKGRLIQFDNQEDHYFATYGFDSLESADAAEKEAIEEAGMYGLYMCKPDEDEDDETTVALEEKTNEIFERLGLTEEEMKGMSQDEINRRVQELLDEVRAEDDDDEDDTSEDWKKA